MRVVKLINALTMQHISYLTPIDLIRQESR